MIAGGLDYTLTVEQCEGGDPSQNPGGGSASASPTPDPKASPTPDPASASPAPDPQRSSDRENMLDSGGPEFGPVPLMPDGGCMKEYPIKRKGGCYR